MKTLQRILTVLFCAALVFASCDMDVPPADLNNESSLESSSGTKGSEEQGEKAQLNDSSESTETGGDSGGEDENPGETDAEGDNTPDGDAKTDSNDDGGGSQNGNEGSNSGDTNAETGGTQENGTGNTESGSNPGNGDNESSEGAGGGDTGVNNGDGKNNSTTGDAHGGDAGDGTETGGDSGDEDGDTKTDSNSGGGSSGNTQGGEDGSGNTDNGGNSGGTGGGAGDTGGNNNAEGGGGDSDNEGDNSGAASGSGSGSQGGGADGGSGENTQGGSKTENETPAQNNFFTELTVYKIHTSGTDEIIFFTDGNAVFSSWGKQKGPQRASYELSDASNGKIIIENETFNFNIAKDENDEKLSLKGATITDGTIKKTTGEDEKFNKLDMSESFRGEYISEKGDVLIITDFYALWYKKNNWKNKTSCVTYKHYNTGGKAFERENGKQEKREYYYEVNENKTEIKLREERKGEVVYTFTRVTAKDSTK